MNLKISFNNENIFYYILITFEAVTKRLYTSLLSNFLHYGGTLYCIKEGSK